MTTLGTYEPIATEPIQVTAADLLTMALESGEQVAYLEPGVVVLRVGGITYEWRAEA